MIVAVVLGFVVGWVNVGNVFGVELTDADAEGAPSVVVEAAEVGTATSGVGGAGVVAVSAVVGTPAASSLESELNA